MRLGSLLIRDGLISLDQLEAALCEQVLAGGKLGTHLVRLGHVSIDVLGSYLSRALGAPATTEAMVAEADAAAIEAVPLSVAGAHHACPLRFVAEGEGQVLEAAVADPSDDEARRALESAVHVPVRLRVAPELLVERGLERWYGLPRRLRTVPPRAPDHMPRPLRIEPFSRDPAPFADAMVDVERAESLLEVAQIVVRFARGRVQSAVFFLVDGVNATGWVGFAPGLDDHAVQRLSFTLDTPCTLSAALLARLPRRGPPRGSLDPQIAAALGASRPPEEILVVPLVEAGHTEALLWTHARSLGRFDDKLVEELATLVAQS